MRKLVIPILLLVASSASAQSIYRRYDGFPGKNELTAEMGLQASLGGTTPAGFKLFFDYAHRLSNIVWLDFKVNPTFDTGYRGGTCVDQFGNVYACDYAGIIGNGYAIDLLAGVKLKWLVLRNHRLMPYCNINGGVVPVFARPAGDNGAAVVVNTGGGVKYFVHPRVGLGAEMNVTLGPGFYGGPNGHNELYRAFNFALGAEFVL